jgi:NDP-sugar pyrophosphorylase family protein
VIDEAVVLAAGEGRRLRPVSERYAKAVLPIDGRPVVATLLRELAGAGIRRVTLVTGHLADQVESLAGEGTAFGLEIRTVRQPSPDGSADALACALAAGADAPFLVSAADTVFRPGDVGLFARAADGMAGAIAFRRGLTPEPGKPGIAVAGAEVERVVDFDPEGALTSAPLWAVGPELLPFFDELPGPPFELADAFQRAVDAGSAISAVEIGKTRDLTYPVDLVKENFPYLAVTP